MKKNEIYMIHGTEYKKMTKQLLQEADLAGHIPSAGCRIGIKPNLVSDSDPSWGATTHPEIVAGIIEYLREHGQENLVIMEGSWVGSRTADVWKLCGYDRLAEEYQVDWIDTQKDSSYSCDCHGMKLQICDCVRSIDFLINVPVLKGHCQTRITCALKNMKGLIPNREKRRFHSLGLHRPIAHLAAAIPQGFVVVDNICGDLDFEDGGNPVVMNRILAGVDPVLIDAYVCDLLHYRKEDVPYLGMAEELGAGCADISKARIRACNEPEQEIAVARREKVVEVQDKVEEVESCSACYGYLIPALSMLKEEGLLEQLQEKICIGQGFRGRTGRLGVGNCTRGFACSLEGCPPTETQIYEFLKTYLQHRKG